MSLPIDELNIVIVVSALTFIFFLYIKITRLEYEIVVIKNNLKILYEKFKSSKTIEKIIKEIPQPTKTIIIKEDKYSKLIAYGTIISAIAFVISLILKFIP